MNISYNWLGDFLPHGSGYQPQIPGPEAMAALLTSIGLEVESLVAYESVRGSLKGLVVGEVLRSEPHPNADKLKLTQVSIGAQSPVLQIVCGAPNVAAGQKVIVAPVGAVIFPIQGEAITMKTAKIRGVESQGMICAADEIGLGADHSGILLLPDQAVAGSSLQQYLPTYADHIFSIGLTPNHMDAMSHLGVARDVCAYLAHHQGRQLTPRVPSVDGFAVSDRSLPMGVRIENHLGCRRYSAVSIKGVQIRESPSWMQDKLKAIGVRPINNIVDITNYVLHELGQPLHAFDLDQIRGRQITVKNLPSGTPFLTLDKREITLDQEDLVICDDIGPLCLAGVYGGFTSGVSAQTRNIFLESAWFDPQTVRKTSFRHDLRTDAATHFEKGMDISGTVGALKRAALLICELAAGELASDVIDVYPEPRPKTQVLLPYRYLDKLSGKHYPPKVAKAILLALGFELLEENPDQLLVAVPYHKSDIGLAADLVEEIMRIDGYDQVAIPTSIRMSPSVELDRGQSSWRHKVANFLVGTGFREILTNSITNSAYYQETELTGGVKMINNLSAELNMLRPSMLETGLEALAFNINRKNPNLRLFEFGKTYGLGDPTGYLERNHLSLYLTGLLAPDSWRSKAQQTDFYYLKGLCASLMRLMNLDVETALVGGNDKLAGIYQARLSGKVLVEAGEVNRRQLEKFEIKQPVFFADFDWDGLVQAAGSNKLVFRELPRQQPVHRDLAMVVGHTLPFVQVEETLRKIRLEKLQGVQLFDIFESDKIGAGKKSLALSFTFLDEEKTLTDKEIDAMMQKIMRAFEAELDAEIRK